MKVFLILLFGTLGTLCFVSPAWTDRQDSFLQTLGQIEDQLHELLNEKGQEPGKNALQELTLEQKITAVVLLWKTKYLVGTALDKALDTLHENRPYKYPYSIY